MREVSATAFTRNFGHYLEIVQREPVAVPSHGQAAGYFVSAADFEELQRIKISARRSRAVAELTTEYIDKITSARMDPEHDHLNTLLLEQACCENRVVLSAAEMLVEER